MNEGLSTNPSRPNALTVVAENIPAELKQLNQWVVWRYEFIKGKWTKPLYQVSGQHAASTNPSTWTSFDAALRRYQSGGVDGIGFVPTAENNITGIDLDHCFEPEARKGEQWAIDIIHQMRSYSEFSPSGTGVRIFAMGSLPEGIGGRKKGNIEVYSASRYLTVTGHRLKNAPWTIETRQDAINELYDRIFGVKQKARESGNGKGNQAHFADDDDLLAKAFQARNGSKIERLFNGDTSAYPSQSEADMALCSMLAFWTQDEAQLDRFFRRSQLMRDKWDEKHGARTYGENIIEKVFEGRTEHYERRQNGTQSRGTIRQIR
jgi:putative DNA primase/helicase